MKTLLDGVDLLWGWLEVESLLPLDGMEVETWIQLNIMMRKESVGDSHHRGCRYCDIYRIVEF